MVSDLNIVVTRRNMESVRGFQLPAPALPGFETHQLNSNTCPIRLSKPMLKHGLPVCQGFLKLSPLVCKLPPENERLSSKLRGVRLSNDNFAGDKSFRSWDLK